MPILAGLLPSRIISTKESSGEDWLKSPADTAVHLSQGKWRHASHVDLISDEITELEHEPIFLIINVPPRHGKSQLISRWTPVWFLKKWPHKHVILASYQAGFASYWGGEVKDTIASNSHELRLSLSQDTKSKAHWRIRGYGGGMIATGIGGPITGHGGDLIIIDDPIKNQKEAMSVIYRENLKQWYRSTLRTRLQPNGSIIILMTRWHENDLCGWLIKYMKGELEGEDEISEDLPHDHWKVINLKAIADPSESEPDPLGRKPGEVLWSEMYDDKALAALKISVGPFWWAAQFQGSPRPEGGGLFKEGWFKYYDPKKRDELKLNRFIQFWDTAHKENQSNDRSACITFAEGLHGYYILDLWVGRPIFPDLVRQTDIEYKKWLPDSVEVEDKASGISLIQQLRRDTKIPIRAIKAVDDKVIRANSVTGIVEAGRVWLPARAPWLSTFLSEVCSFPAAEHDDITDTFVYGLMHYKPRRVDLGKIPISERTESKWRELK